MDAKEKAELLRFLSETHRDQLVDRRKYEWKIIFTVLTFYVLVPATRLEVRIDIFPHSLIYVLFAALAFATTLGLVCVHLGHHKNLRTAERAEAGLQALLKDEPFGFDILPGQPAKDTFCTWIKRGPWQWIWQTIVIMFFAFTSAMITCANGDLLHR